ncbi:hypothetical protein [Haloarcula amylovorans]|uniref:hypothetical protein n=1 Tax=Haloarcula amylovorans TaxID=2562280 RepID=UPI0010763CE5|nr:hypothetical protein [Halomicroarcula amylolytica]
MDFPARLGGFGTWQLLWVLVTVGLLLPFENAFPPSLRVFEMAFLTWFIGFLVGVELLVSDGAAQSMRQKRYVVVAGGIAVTVAIVVRHVFLLRL